jgi:hypothetical protein
MSGRAKRMGANFPTSKVGMRSRKPIESLASMDGIERPWTLAACSRGKTVVPSDPKDYEAFEATVISDYDASSAVERGLVLRLASVLWRLRRATGIETALFEAMTERPCNFSPKTFNWTYDFAESDQLSKDNAQEANEAMRNDPRSVRKQHIAESFLRLSDLPTCPMDRLSRYEQRLSDRTHIENIKAPEERTRTRRSSVLTPP